MLFKSQVEADMHAVLFKQVDELKEVCALVRDSTQLQALMQVVLSIGNALNAGTAKGNATGFKASSLLKLAELKAADKKSTLLHFTVEAVQSNAPQIAGVLSLLPHVSAATKVSLEELRAKRLELEKGLEQVDAELLLLEAAKSEAADAGNDGVDDQFTEVLTDFYNWAAEHRDLFEKVAEMRAEICAVMRAAPPDLWQHRRRSSARRWTNSPSCAPSSARMGSPSPRSSSRCSPSS